MSDTGNKYKTIIMSDIHLGMKDSKANEVIDFLEKNTCDTLILNGDIIDGWALKRGNTLKEAHMKCIRKIIKLSEKNTEVYWLRGNHDDFLDNFIPTNIGKINIQQTLDIYSNNKKYLVIHGDIFDLFITKMKWLAKIGSIAYDTALSINRIYNKYRKLRNKPYLSLSKKLKDNVKYATSFIGDFETHLTTYAQSKNYDGVICGHIHYPVIKYINDLHYMNSGDWVENMSCLVEKHNNKWQLKYY